jgi:hypothetical protein
MTMSEPTAHNDADRGGGQDWLDAALRGGAAPALSDDGFSARVLRQLAAERRGPPVTAAQALSRWRERSQSERRQARYAAVGAAIGGLLGGGLAAAMHLAPAGASALAAPTGSLLLPSFALLAGVIALAYTVVRAEAD